MSKHSKTFRLVASILLTLLPIILFFVYFQTYKVNYPQHEEHYFTSFMVHWPTMSWDDRITGLFAQGFGHRYPYARLISLFSTWLHGGELDYTHTMVGGILYFLAFYALFLYLFYKNRIPLLYATPLLFLLFQPQLRVYVFWALTNQLYLPSLFFSMLAVWLVTRDGWWRIPLAVIFQWIAVGGFSSGLFGYGAVGLVLLIRRKYLPLLIWTGIAVLTAALYFRNYMHPGWGLPAPDPTVTPPPYWLQAIYFAIYTGSLFVYKNFLLNIDTFRQPIFWVPLLSGVLAWVLIALGLGKSTRAIRSGARERMRRYPSSMPPPPVHYRVALFFVGTAALLLVTCYLIVVARTSSAVGGQVLSDRLKIYPVIVLGLAYLGAFMVFNTARSRTIIFSVALPLSVLAWLGSYYFQLGDTQYDTRLRQAHLFNYGSNENSYLGDYGIWGGRTQQFNYRNMKEAERIGLYQIKYLPYLQNATPGPLAEVPPVETRYDSTSNSFTFSLPGFRPEQQEQRHYYLLLKNDNYQFVFPMQAPVNSLTNFVKTGRYLYGDLLFSVQAVTLPAQTFQLGTLYYDGANPRYRMQRDSLRVPEWTGDRW
ncbi:hypothetical protein GCM10027275_43360 [Rhabdobacter roseus]|uniref:YfhO family protein n=1 Tax=Rhabdobacter roseus TaxID=1655419 RepID=A0A840U446_9BACT|nr:hypothetical protein [Rhabdobacter roseus]MBB5286609.1 hypothetical protein [Rhabdobacter roseus]